TATAPCALHDALPISRDLWVPLATGGTAKIDGAYSYGGAKAAIQTVQNDFGVHVNYYVWIGLVGLIRVIDAIGGVDVVTSNPVRSEEHTSELQSLRHL